jgi:negative regulator of sigma E activity
MSFTQERYKDEVFIVEESHLGIDVLAENGDILQEFRINDAAFRWLRGRWHFKVEKH